MLSTMRYNAPESTGNDFHDLRHLAASLMLAQDVNPKVMQEILGHSQFSTTMDVYSHLMPTAKRDAAKRMDALFTEPD